MNFTKTVPTEAGDYWWKLDHGSSFTRSRYVNSELGTSVAGAVQHVSEVGGLWGPRITPPQVPDEVLEVRARWSDARRGIGKWDNRHTRDIQIICDFIDHIAPPEVPLPKFRRFKVTLDGKSGVGVAERTDSCRCYKSSRILWDDGSERFEQGHPQNYYPDLEWLDEVQQ